MVNLIMIVITNRQSALRRLTILFLLLVGFPAYQSFSQNHSLKFTHLSLEQGLSQSYVKCIFQDSRGFMWFGTSEGLNKYDGYKFTVYKFNSRVKDGISHNQINDIMEDKDGNIWIATWDGLNMFDRKT